MQLKHLNFVHFFISEKEYLLELDTIKNISISKNKVQIFFKESDSIPTVTEFFVKYAEEEFLFFFGDDDKVYDSPVVSRTCYYSKSAVEDKIFFLEFEVRG